MKIAVWYGIFSMGLFIACTSEPHLPDPLEAGWKGEKVCEVLEENDSIRILKCTFPPGVGHEKHYHPPHFAYSLKATTYRLEDEHGVRELEFPKGSSYYSEGVDWHTALNIGTDTGVVLIIEPK